MTLVNLIQRFLDFSRKSKDTHIHIYSLISNLNHFIKSKEFKPELEFASFPKYYIFTQLEKTYFFMFKALFRTLN